MPIKLDWETGNPKKPGIYFVAMKLGPAAGFYDLILWSGQQWETDTQGDVIAHIDAEGLKAALNIQWPQAEEVAYHPRTLSDNDQDLWSED